MVPVWASLVAPQLAVRQRGGLKESGGNTEGIAPRVAEGGGCGGIFFVAPFRALLHYSWHACMNDCLQVVK